MAQLLSAFKGSQDDDGCVPAGIAADALCAFTLVVAMDYLP
jgi:hypothetical protein